MDKRCSICTHDQKQAIDQAIIENKPINEIIALYGVSKSSLYRHKKSHLADSIAKQIQAVGIGMLEDSNCSDGSLEAETIAAQLKYLYGAALKTMDSCERNSDYITSIKAQRQALSCLETFFRAAETLYKMKASKRTISDAEKMRSVIMEALESHPTARASVAEAIGRAITGHKDQVDS